MRVLLVEDDEMIGANLQQALEAAGWSVDWVRDGRFASHAWSESNYTCVLLDLGLPREDGIDVLRRARARGDMTPVLVLTARDSVAQRIQGLDSGADDYLLKPFDLQEVLARMRAITRRRHGAADSLLGSGDVQLDMMTREVLYKGQREQLAAREYALLYALLDKLRAAWSAQRQFLEDAAHELRTPVTAVTLQLENLRQHIQPGEARRQFDQLEAGVTRTRHLVTQLLAVSRQEDRAAVPVAEIIELDDLLKESIEQLMVVADKRGIDIGYSGSTRYRLQASRSELRTLFDNVIGNAMLHTPEGSLVDVLLHRAGDRTVVDIVDNGSGMPESFLERAFDRFTRSPDVQAQGSGLGLSIVRSVAQKHQMQVALSNCLTPQGERCGLRVRVTLP